MTDTSSRTDGFLNNTHHYDFEASKLRTYKDRNIDSEGFYGWTKDHMYRTSYVSAYTDKPVLQKSLAMPKYQGYIPYVGPEGIHAKGYTPITKDCFANERLTKNALGLATTGHNYKYEANLDQSMNATSSKYGKSALQRAHPAWSVHPSPLRSTAWSPLPTTPTRTPTSATTPPSARPRSSCRPTRSSRSPAASARTTTPSTAKGSSPCPSSTVPLASLRSQRHLRVQEPLQRVEILPPQLNPLQNQNPPEEELQPQS